MDYYINEGDITIVDEMCPYCNTETTLKIALPSRLGICEHCKKKILACSLCNMDSVNCTECPYIEGRE